MYIETSLMLQYKKKLTFYPWKYERPCTVNLLFYIFVFYIYILVRQPLFVLKQTYLWRALNEHFTVVTFWGESALACDFCLLLFNQCTVCDDNVHVFHN